jgi:hypothetical protein
MLCGTRASRKPSHNRNEGVYRLVMYMDKENEKWYYVVEVIGHG